MADLTTVCVKFPPDDLAVLEALEDAERLKRSDVVRRAIRAYAKQLGVGEPTKKQKR
jgi:Ribbon-helix-helix protein, copG family